MGWSLPAPGAHLLRASGVGLCSSAPARAPLLEGGHKGTCDEQPEGARLPPVETPGVPSHSLLATGDMTCAIALAASPSSITSCPGDTSSSLARLACVQGVICPSRQCPRRAWWARERQPPSHTFVPRLQGIWPTLLGSRHRGCLSPS